jgi:proline iminopeptidase
VTAESERFVPVEGGEIWTSVEGQGRPILLASGGPGCCDYLAPLAELLRGLGRVIRFEARGCGRSSLSESYGLGQTLGDLDRVLDAHAATDVVFVGHSWGADLGLAFALEQRSRVRALLGVAGGRIVDDREWSRLYHERREREGELEPDYAFPPNLAVNRALNAEWRAYCKAPDLLARLARLDVPALLVTASNDIRPSWPTEQLAALLPRGVYRQVAGAGHVIWETHAKELATILRGFIESLGEV